MNYNMRMLLTGFPFFSYPRFIKSLILRTALNHPEIESKSWSGEFCRCWLPRPRFYKSGEDNIFWCDKCDHRLLADVGYKKKYV